MSTSTEHVALEAELVAAIDATGRACRAYGRTDLLARVDAARSGGDDSVVRIAVVGAFKKGKSSLLNGLLGLDVCPIDDDAPTQVSTIVSWGQQQRARVRHADGTLNEVAIDEVADAVVTGATDDRFATEICLYLPHSLLASGVELLDMPSVGGLASRRALDTLERLTTCLGVVFVTDATQELTRTELEFLGSAARLGPSMVCVVTKTDISPAWRRIVDLDRRHLERHGLQLPLIALSTEVRRLAIAESDRSLNHESGYPALIDWIRDAPARATADRARATRQLLIGVVDQLDTQFRAELDVLDDPGLIARVEAELAAARARSDRLRSGLAKWNQTLNDGIADLGADADHDFRVRQRQLLSEVDTAIEGTDPAETWAEFGAWLDELVVGHVTENHALVRERAERLSAGVAEHFHDPLAGESIRASLAHVDTPAITNTGEQLRLAPQQRFTLRAQGMLAVKSYYSTSLMVGMVSSVAGLTLGPLGLAVGVVAGKKGVAAEQKRRLEQRRTQARTVARKYIDDVAFQVSKSSRDALRSIHRQLRDHYTASAEELHLTAVAAMTAAQTAAQRTTADAALRRADVVAELARIDGLRQRVLSATAVSRPAARPTGVAGPAGDVA